MNTPICDFVNEYARSNALRLHMPGHKGAGMLGVEALDITEIDGADSLYSAQGIIRESEDNASRLFGCRTFYSTEGSSLCIRAMLFLALQHARAEGRPARVIAGRNAHKTFLGAAALLDLEVDWIYPAQDESYLACRVEPAALEEMLAAAAEKPAAVYITSPDYLGNTADIAALSAVCRRHGVLLLVDNAHGAYLKFLPESRHPMDLGADICCDSAHKTLPVLTGGAYLHISESLPDAVVSQARPALALFGSTSPSYLILQSLDAANAYIAGDYRERLARFCAEAQDVRKRLEAAGIVLCGDEPMKLTLDAKRLGCSGYALSEYLLEQDIFCEFADPDFLVLMITPEIGSEGLHRLCKALETLPRKDVQLPAPPVFRGAERVLSIREAAFSAREVLPAEECAGRVLADPTVGCPPAVPIVVSGERIDEHALTCFAYYGIRSCTVVKQ